jgi:hypothetical protein
MNAQPDALRKQKPSSNTRLIGWRLWMAWAIWAVVFLLVSYVALATIPEYIKDALGGFVYRP